MKPHFGLYQHSDIKYSTLKRAEQKELKACIAFGQELHMLFPESANISLVWGQIPNPAHPSRILDHYRTLFSKVKIAYFVFGLTLVNRKTDRKAEIPLSVTPEIEQPDAPAKKRAILALETLL